MYIQAAEGGYCVSSLLFFNTTEGLSQALLLSQGEPPPEVWLMLANPQERVEC